MHGTEQAQGTVRKHIGMRHVGMRFLRVLSEVLDVTWIKVSFDPWQRSFFLYLSAQQTQKEKRPLLAGKSFSQLYTFPFLLCTVTKGAFD